jgi:phosphoadenosine phosphosulfate reductase
MPNLNAKISEALDVLIGADGLGRVALASSLSAEDMVLTHLIALHDLSIDVFAIDTGMLHPQTVALIGTARQHYGLGIEVFYPDDSAVETYIKTNGKHAFYDSLDLRLSCCAIRKVEPLERALKGRSGWITGQRREQATSRQTLELVETDAARGIAKFNPLATWSFEDVMAFVDQHHVPINPLHAQGYPSIGCEPCTRAVRPGEDPRAGRWWWEQSDAKECGLHVKEAVS